MRLYYVLFMTMFVMAASPFVEHNQHQKAGDTNLTNTEKINFSLSESSISSTMNETISSEINATDRFEIPVTISSDTDLKFDRKRNLNTTDKHHKKLSSKMDKKSHTKIDKIYHLKSTGETPLKPTKRRKLNAKKERSKTHKKMYTKSPKRTPKMYTKSPKRTPSKRRRKKTTTTIQSFTVSSNLVSPVPFRNVLNNSIGLRNPSGANNKTDSVKNQTSVHDHERHLRNASGVCYQCRTDQDDRCQDGDVSNDFLKPCTVVQGRNFDEIDLRDDEPRGQSVYCRKIVQYLNFVNTTPSTVVIRECTGFHKNADACYQDNTNAFDLEVCECKASGCNKSSFLRISNNVLCFSVALWLVLFYFTQCPDCRIIRLK